MPFLMSCLACVALTQAAAAMPWSSPLADYRRFDAEAAPKPWRAANEEVLASGGHVGLLKSARPAAAAQPAPGKARPPAPEAGPPRPREPAPAAKPGHDHGSHK